MDRDEKISVVEIISEGNAVVVAFKTASISNVEEIAAASRQIKEFIEEKQPKEVVVDFECVKFFSSAVLGLLLDIRAKLKTYDGEVVISAINPQLYRVFKITHLDRIFKFFPDKENAVKAVSTN
jgi:anti-sigma B factor antagonist